MDPCTLIDMSHCLSEVCMSVTGLPYLHTTLFGMQAPSQHRASYMEEGTMRHGVCMAMLTQPDRVEALLIVDVHMQATPPTCQW